MTTILYYGIGNPTAFLNVFKRINRDCKIVTCKSDLKKASKIILPGVGHFDDAMFKLNSSGMIDDLNELVLEKSVPVLGICVGMQIMALNSEEGSSNGLGWIDGHVRKFENVICPHMGGMTLRLKRMINFLMILIRNYFIFYIVITLNVTI